MGTAGITGLRKCNYNISPCSVSGFEPVSQGMDMDLPENQHTKMAGFERKVYRHCLWSPGEKAVKQKWDSCETATY